MGYVLDWDRVKHDIDIEQYFMFKFGFMFEFDKYKKAYVNKNDNSNGDIIRFFYHEKTGIKMYYSILFQDSGDIIQFIKNRILKNSNASASEINQEILNFTGSSVLNTTVEKKVKPSLSQSKDVISEYQASGDVSPDIEKHLEYLTQYRKLDIELIKSPMFKDVFFSYRTNNTESLAFNILDIEGHRVGIVRIQTQQNEYFNKKWFDKGSRNSIGFTFSNLLPNTETLSIFESIFDAISFQEMHRLQKAVYCSTNGELSFKKANLIFNFFKKNHFKYLILGNDSDLAGYFFNLNIIGSFIPGLVNIHRYQENISIELETSLEDKKAKVISQFFKNMNLEKELKKSSSSSQTFRTETLSQGIIRYTFLIENTIESIQFFVGLLLRVYDLGKMITIFTPKNKDFNEDLIQLKTHRHGEERE